ncbi:hypothetical protein PtA15_11A485 [Puccinia triticina]|uniref:Replication factor A C-terminal domain-containing protein n=1 Tax=Puccinia triticina TaxID=208348 RepID=A0ABY7CWW5_9BASI|nr:uncharacterized protein PtA15_11A485 [Puccinia triticina]WAQ89794.1 hypothetical protein PtA15_11A485 [Puccinia triticina]WAR59839.1 hypothetical protein PtB15_11B480 [Puccinia triticina]
MKITLHNVLACSYSILTILSNQRTEARALEDLDPRTAHRLGTRDLRRVKARPLRRRAIPHGIYHSCTGGGLSRICEDTIRAGWTDGTLKTIKTEVRSFTDGTHPCKVTVWTETAELKLVSVEQLLEAMLQIDDYCTAIDLKVATPCEDSSDYEGVFVGKLVRQTIPLNKGILPSEFMIPSPHKE